MLFSVLLFLYFASAVLSASKGGCKDPGLFLDQFFESVQQDSQADSAQLKDLKVQVPYGAQDADVYLRDGHVYGVATQADRQGKATARYISGSDHKCYIGANLYYPRLRVKYNEVDIQTNSDQGVDADYYEGYIYGLEAYFQVTYDEESDEIESHYYYPFFYNAYEYKFGGAKENQDLAHAYKLWVAVGKAVYEGMKQRVKEYVEYVKNT